MNELQVDIGNTRAKYRILGQQGRVAGGVCGNHDLPAIAIAHDVGRITIASVQEKKVQARLSGEFAEAGLVDIVWLATAPRFGEVINAYPDYQCLGIDRWLAIIAGYYKYQRPCCIFDFGSAVTVDLVDAGGRHLGGYIIPGSALCFAALGQNTAALQPEMVLSTSDVVGTDTEVCIQNGIYILQTAFIKDILNSLNEQFIVCTGGGFSQVEKAFLGRDYSFDKELILDGISMVTRAPVS